MKVEHLFFWFKLVIILTYVVLVDVAGIVVEKSSAPS